MGRRLQGPVRWHMGSRMPRAAAGNQGPWQGSAKEVDGACREGGEQPEGVQPWALRSGVGGGSGEAESEGRVLGGEAAHGMPSSPRREEGPVHPR